MGDIRTQQQRCAAGGVLMLIAAIMGAMGGAPGVINANLPNGRTVSPELPVWTLRNDGTYNISGAQAGNWVSPATAEVAAYYQVKVDVTSGTLELGTTGVWLDLSTTRSWGKNILGTATFTVSIREKATQIVRSVQPGVTLTVEPP